jgi:hypothetical protein
MASTRTKAVVALGLLDLARQVARAWSAREQAHRNRTVTGASVKRDARRILESARDTAREHAPWHHEPTLRERARAWGPVALVISLASVAVVIASRMVARRQPHDVDAQTTDSKVVGAVRAGGAAIDSAVTKVVDNGSVAAVGAAAGVAAGSAAVRQAVAAEVKDQVDERVITPARQKAIRYGSLGLAGLTAWVVVVAVVVYLVLALIT